MATVLPAFNPVAGVAQALGPVAQMIGQRRQQERLRQQQLQQRQQQAQQFGNLAQQIQGGQPINFGGITNPAVAQMALQQIIKGQGQQSGVLASPGQQLLNPQTGQPIGQGVPFQQEQQPGFSLSPGQTRFGPGGQPIASVEEKAIPQAKPLQLATEGDQSGLPAGTAFQTLPNGEVKIVSEPGGAGLTGKDRVNIAVNESKAFRSDERIANLNIIERSERGMQAALRQSKTAKSRIASDQALGVLFQKMLDPTSVVRESEFARTPEGAALINRVIGGAQQIIKGGLKMTDEDRDALVSMAQKLLDESKITANKAFSEFETRADEINLNKKIVFGGFKPFDMSQQTEQPNTPGLTEALNQGASRFGLPSIPSSKPNQSSSSELQRLNKEIAELEALR